MRTKDITSLLKEHVLDFIIDSGVPVVTHEGQEYAQVSWLCKLLGISTGDLRRKFNYHQDLMIRQFNKKFIRVDYIPWWLVNLHGNLNLSEDALERVEQALDRLGIPVPAL